MIHYCNNNLEGIKHLLCQLSKEQYCQKSEMLSTGTIGKHTRHILEFYLALIKSRETGIINYDKRVREFLLETEVAAASERISYIQASLLNMADCNDLILCADYSQHGDIRGIFQINTTFHRELAYNLEHSIHHMALIKVALIDFNLANLVDDNFGVAVSTIRHKMETA